MPDEVVRQGSFSGRLDWLPAVVVMLCAQAIASAAAGQHVQAIPEGYEIVQHIIRPGDTLISVTREYLGSSRLWELNYQLNPEKVVLSLQPGERLLVLIDPKKAPLSARVIKRSGTVEAQPNPLRWIGAEDNDLLVEKDAARTRKNSSTQLAFADGTSVVITEDSLVFLRNLGRGLSTVATNRTPQKVELMEGQADLSSLGGTPTPREDIEVVMGTSTLKLPKESPVRTRTALNDGKSKVGLYQGNASFQAASGAVGLATGEGLVASGTEPPQKEKLLLAPSLGDPAERAELLTGSLGSLHWVSPGAGAVSYTVEICNDSSCGSLIDRRTALTGTEAALPTLGAGSYFWRITAASASGLDGYPSTARSFTVIDLPVDNDPPAVALALEAFGVPYQNLPAYGPEIPLDFSVSDVGTGLANSGLMVDGRERAQSGEFSTGRHEIRAFGVDRANQRTESDPVVVFVDADPPTLSITSTGAPEVKPRPNDRPRSQRGLRRAKNKGATFEAASVFAVDETDPLGYSLDSLEWRPLAALELGLLTDSSEVELVLMDGFCLKRSNEGPPSAADAACGRQYLTVRAADEHTGVKILGAIISGDTLTIEATDEVGNSTSFTFALSGK